MQEIARKPDGVVPGRSSAATTMSGDEEIERAKMLTGLIEIDESRFIPKWYRRAIGGAQIVPGGVVRKHGYVPLKWFQQPAATWRRAIEDVYFRRLLGPQQYAIDLPGVYGIRRSKCGRVDVGCEL